MKLQGTIKSAKQGRSVGSTPPPAYGDQTSIHSGFRRAFAGILYFLPPLLYRGEEKGRKKNPALTRAGVWNGKFRTGAFLCRVGQRDTVICARPNHRAPRRASCHAGGTPQGTAFPMECGGHRRAPGRTRGCLGFSPGTCGGRNICKAEKIRPAARE